MADVKEALHELMTIGGAVAAAVADLESGMTLGEEGRIQFPPMTMPMLCTVLKDFNKAGNQVRAGNNIKNVLATYQDHLVVLHALTGSCAGLATILVLEPENANLAMANHKVKNLDITV